MARLHRRVWCLLLVLIVTAVVLSCTIYDSALLLPAPADAGADADDCTLARWPRRPTTNDAPGGGTVEFVNVLDSVDYGLEHEGGVPRTFGFDLDGVCTCPLPRRGGSCRLLDDVDPRCDLDDGRDDAVSQLLVEFSAVSNAFSQSAINDSLRQGRYGLLVRVRNYNGMADDPNVEVAVFNSTAGLGDAADGGAPPVPHRDGTDEFTVNPGSLTGGNGPPFVPKYVDVNAYVANHRLVATIDFPLTFGVVDGAVSVTVDMKGSIVVATLVPDGDTFRLDEGNVGGRWPVARLLPALEVLPDPFAPTTYLCGDSPSYALVKSLVCSAQDLVSDVRQDNTGAPCDSLSLAVGFTASPARLGRVVAPPPARKPCGPQWADDCPR